MTTPPPEFVERVNAYVDSTERMRAAFDDVIKSQERIIANMESTIKIQRMMIDLLKEKIVALETTPRTW